MSTHSTVLTLALLLCGVSALAEDWPHWRGPERNDVSAESSRFDEGAWPPVELWRTQVGEGSTSPVVVGSQVYVLGWFGEQDTLHCLEAATGRSVWTQSYPSPRYGRQATGDEGLYSGVTSTPEYDRQTGLLFTLGTDGDLNAWDTKRGGRRAWGLNLYERYDVPQRPRVGRSGLRDYGYTSSPLAQGGGLIVEVGAKQGTLISFDKRSGRQQWASENGDPAGHNGGPVPMLVEGVSCVAVLNHEGLLVARTDKGQQGRTVATFPWQTEFGNNIATPAVDGDTVFLTSGYNQARTCAVRVTLAGAETIWEQRIHSKVCSPVIHGGRIYWAFERLLALDQATGETPWQEEGFADAGSCIATADNRLIVFSGKGALSLFDLAAEAPPQGRLLARLNDLFSTDVWPHVVLAGGRLYAKDRNGELICFGLGDSSTP